MNRKCLDTAEIAAMGRTELLSHWPEYFDLPPPRRASLGFLRMALAWQVQAEGRGVSTSRIDRRLRRIGVSFALGWSSCALVVCLLVRDRANLNRT